MNNDLSAETIQKISRGFTLARILLTGVELDIFSLLAEQPLSAAKVCSKLDLDLRAATIFLDVLSALGYLEKQDDLYRTEPSLIPILAEGPPESILPGLRHGAHLWNTWTQLTDVVRKGGPAKRLENASEKQTRDFIGAMHVSASKIAHEVVEAVSPGKAKKLIDVGGGSGSYTIAFLEANPGIRATLFDLPDVMDMARERISDSGLMDRVRLVGGDFNKDNLPTGHDLAFLSAIIHQNSHEQNVALYKKVINSLDAGGRIVVRDYTMSADRTEPASGALFAVNMLVNTDGGNSYTLDEIRDGLAEAGFEKIRSMQEKEMSSLVEGFRPLVR